MVYLWGHKKKYRGNSQRAIPDLVQSRHVEESNSRESRHRTTIVAVIYPFSHCDGDSVTGSWLLGRCGKLVPVGWLIKTIAT